MTYSAAGRRSLIGEREGDTSLQLSSLIALVEHLTEEV